MRSNPFVHLATASIMVCAFACEPAPEQTPNSRTAQSTDGITGVATGQMTTQYDLPFFEYGCWGSMPGPQTFQHDDYRLDVINGSAKTIGGVFENVCWQQAGWPQLVPLGSFSKTFKFSPSSCLTGEATLETYSRQSGDHLVYGETCYITYNFRDGTAEGTVWNQFDGTISH